MNNSIRMGRSEGVILMQLLITELLSEFPSGTWQTTAFDRRVEKAMDLMDAYDPSHPTGNQELARAVNMSINAFIRLFSQEVGKSPMRYLLDRRIDKAAILLVHSDWSINQIADECGFCDRYHLSKAFRKFHSMAPARFRKGWQHAGSL